VASLQQHETISLNLRSQTVPEAFWCLAGKPDVLNVRQRVPVGLVDVEDMLDLPASSLTSE
jgi:hypothetical protein